MIVCGVLYSPRPDHLPAKPDAVLRLPQALAQTS